MGNEITTHSETGVEYTVTLMEPHELTEDVLSELLHETWSAGDHEGYELVNDALAGDQTGLDWSLELINNTRREAAYMRALELSQPTWLREPLTIHDALYAYERDDR